MLQKCLKIISVSTEMMEGNNSIADRNKNKKKENMKARNVNKIINVRTNPKNM